MAGNDIANHLSSLCVSAILVVDHFDKTEAWKIRETNAELDSENKNMKLE